jgi:hypothetical protein
LVTNSGFPAGNFKELVMAKKQYCVHCPVSERKLLAPQGLAAHTRSRHPGKEVRGTYQKSYKPRKKKASKKKSSKEAFIIEPADPKGNAAQGEYAAEVRIRLVIKVDVES